MSEREYQIERGGTWDKGKGCDTFGPLGPWLVTRDEVPNPQKLAMWLDVNGKRVQTGSTQTMIFSVAKLVSYVSQFMTLEPGDVITTGTPPGVGMGMKPPVYLKAGDQMALGIEGLGEQRQVVVPFQRSEPRKHAPQSSVTPESLTTLPRRTVSFLINSPNCAAVPPTTGVPIASHFLRNSGSLKMVLSVLLSLSMMAAGVPARTAMPCQPVNS